MAKNNKTNLNKIEDLFGKINENNSVSEQQTIEDFNRVIRMCELFIGVIEYVQKLRKEKEEKDAN